MIFLLCLAAACTPKANVSKALPSRDPLPPQTPPVASVSAWVRANDPRIVIMGRTDTSSPEVVRFGYPGVTLFVQFEGSELALRAASTNGKSRLGLNLDGKMLEPVDVSVGEAELMLVHDLVPGRHRLAISHLTETWIGVVSIFGISAGGGELLQADPLPERRLLFIGDSVTCGEAVDRGKDCNKDASWWNASASYGALAARAFDANFQLVCYGGRGLVRDWQGKSDVENAPKFFELAIAEQSPRVPWDHARFSPNAVVVSLGTNDFSLGIGPLPDEQGFLTAYVAFLKEIRAQYPQAFIVLTEGAIVNDQADPARPQKTVLRSYIRKTIELLGDERVMAWNAEHRPGDACDAHPTRAQHALMAQELVRLLSAKLGWEPTAAAM